MKKSITKKTSSENFQMLEKRKKLGSAVDKQDLVNPEVFEQSSTDDQQVLEISDPQLSSKQKRDKLIVGMAMCILLCFLIAGLTILIWFLFDSHEKLIEQLDNQKKDIDDLKQCSKLSIGFTVTFSGKDYKGGCPKIKLINGQPAKFKEVLENVGEGYDRETGYFTATTPGLYSFQINIGAYNKSAACLALRKKNEQPIASAFAEHDSWESGSTSAVLELAAGESVAAVACKDSRFSRPNWIPDLSRSTVFSGYLIEAANCKHGKGISGQKVDTVPTIGNDADEKPLIYQHKRCLEDVCYYLVDSKLTWKEASAECKKYGKVLAEVRTEAQADIIEEIWNFRNDTSEQIWLGGSNLDFYGYEWIWEASEDCIPMIWEEGVQRWTEQPRQPTIDTEGVSCLTQWGGLKGKGLPEGKTSGWNNAPCHYSYRYVCQGKMTKT